MKHKTKIPKGYKVEAITENYSDKQNGKAVINIWLKKKEPEGKSFQWYLIEYEKKIRNISNLYELDVEIPLQMRNFTSIPFEFRIGLLKFICDDLCLQRHEYIEILAILSYKQELSSSRMDKIRQICPKEFLETFK